MLVGVKWHNFVQKDNLLIHELFESKAAHNLKCVVLLMRL